MECAQSYLRLEALRQNRLGAADVGPSAGRDLGRDRSVPADIRPSAGGDLCRGGVGLKSAEAEQEEDFDHHVSPGCFQLVLFYV